MIWVYPFSSIWIRKDQINSTMLSTVIIYKKRFYLMRFLIRNTKMPENEFERASIEKTRLYALTCFKLH